VRLIVSGGGTGGHIYPALAVIEALSAAAPDVETLYLGEGDGMEAQLVPRAGLSFKPVPSGAVVGHNPAEVAASLARVARGVRVASRLIAAHGAEVVLVTGGFVCVPVALAARLRRVPTIVVLPDVVPGLAVRFLAPMATAVAASYPDALRHLPRGRTVLTGYPLRASVWRIDRATARRSFGLAQRRPAIVVLGGSRGAQSINRAIATGLPDLLAQADVIHIAGQRDEPWLRERAAALPKPLQRRYHLFDYLDDAPRALMAADLAVTRAGAATCAELPAAGLPSILVPYPHAAEHQALNARYLVRHGAAVALPDAALDSGALVTTIIELLADTARRAVMAERARRLAVRGGADAVAALVLALGRRRRAA
jgi:UDP-N-acetylglucosamine--N-acetylmuramyl-(pentapeptide) pyrophosphoryl-undecaprenol N-acetylglucosamine transferase